MSLRLLRRVTGAALYGAALCCALPSVAAAQQWGAGLSLAMLNRADPTERVWGTGLRGVLLTPAQIGPLVVSAEGTLWQVRTTRTGLTRGAIRENALEAALLMALPLAKGLALQGGPALSLFLECSSGGTGGIENYGLVRCNDSKAKGDYAMGWTAGIAGGHKGGNAIWRYGVRVGSGTANFGAGKITPTGWLGFTLGI